MENVQNPVPSSFDRLRRNYDPPPPSNFSGSCFVFCQYPRGFGRGCRGLRPDRGLRFCCPCRGGGRVCTPVRGVSGTLCQGIFRAPARGPFGTAQKGRKGRLGAAAPKNPIDVQQIAIFSFRRVDIVLPLRPLPGLRPCPSRHPNCFSPDPAPAAAVEGAGSPKSPPHHEQQEEKRSYCHLVLATTTQQADRRTWESAKVRR